MEEAKNGYPVQQYTGPVKRYCQTLDLRDNPELIAETYGNQVDYVIDGGEGDIVGSTIIDCTHREPDIVRQGKGEIDE